jgi:hypothetical protein
MYEEEADLIDRQFIMPIQMLPGDKQEPVWTAHCPNDLQQQHIDA